MLTFHHLTVWCGIPACHTIPYHTSIPACIPACQAYFHCRWHQLLRERESGAHIISDTASSCILSTSPIMHIIIVLCKGSKTWMQTHIDGDQHVVRLNILWLQQGTSDKAKASIVVCLSLLVELWRSSSSVCKLYFVQPQMQYGGNGAGCLVDFSEGWISIITCGKFFQQDLLEGLCSLPKKKKKALANYQMKLENL